MKYIENNGQVTREYEVKIDTNELENIIGELIAKCYRVISKETRVAANNEKEAIEKINAMDRNGIRVDGLTNISNQYPREVLSSGLQVYNCEYLYRQNPQLVYILETILTNYRSSLDFKNQNGRFLDLLLQYENSEELKPYNERLEEYKKEVLRVGDNEEEQKKLKEKIASIMGEIDYNDNYDFDLLKELYRRAKECFSLVLAAETIHYKDLDKNPKVYKLGTKKEI